MLVANELAVNMPRQSQKMFLNSFCREAALSLITPKVKQMHTLLEKTMETQ